MLEALLRNPNHSCMKVVTIDTRDGSFTTGSSVQNPPQKICGETWIVTFEITQVQGCVVRPIVFGNKKDFSQSTVSPGHNPRANNFDLIVVTQSLTLIRNRRRYSNRPKFLTKSARKKAQKFLFEKRWDVHQLRYHVPSNELIARKEKHRTWDVP